MIGAFPLLESDFYFPLILIYIGLYRRHRVTTHTHPRLQPRTWIAWVRASAVAFRPRGWPAVISPLRVGRHMPPMLLSNGVVRGAGHAEAGRAGHNFQIYVQMFLSRAQIGCGARFSWGKMPIVKFRGELKNALEAFSRER